MHTVGMSQREERQSRLPKGIKGAFKCNSLCTMYSQHRFVFQHATIQRDLRFHCRVRPSGGKIKAGFGSRASLLADHISSTSPARPKVTSHRRQPKIRRRHLHHLPVHLPLITCRYPSLHVFFSPDTSLLTYIHLFLLPRCTPYHYHSQQLLQPHNKLFAATQPSSSSITPHRHWWSTPHSTRQQKQPSTMHLPPTPEPRDLLPPLLACLPTTFVSPRPPPALLPLLAPVLRQRASYLAPGNASEDGWIRLLNWDPERAAKLRPVVDELELEPHPVSGEIELDDLEAIKYRRLDEETLQSRLDAAQFNLAPIYVWCESDEHGDTGPGWKLTELRALQDVEDGTTWHNSVAEANDAANTVSIAVPSTTAQQPAQVQADD